MDLIGPSEGLVPGSIPGGRTTLPNSLKTLERPLGVANSQLLLIKKGPLFNSGPFFINGSSGCAVKIKPSCYKRYTNP
jgi:hypothetical protein